MRKPYPLRHDASAEERAEFSRRAQAGRAFARDENARYADAFAWRQRFAEDRGFPDFAAVLAYGLAAAHNLKTLPDSTT